MKKTRRKNSGGVIERTRQNGLTETLTETHDYRTFAKQYATLGIEGTFYLAYRALAELIPKHIKAKQRKMALDYGCGGGRSTRFLESIGFRKVVGVDTSETMLCEARLQDEKGTYQHIKSARLSIENATIDMVLMNYVLTEVSTKEEMVAICSELKRVMKDDGTMVITTVNSRAFKVDMVSFRGNFPENQNLKSGDTARVVVKGKTPNEDFEIHDYVWLETDYQEVFERVGLKIVETVKPMPRGGEPWEWLSEKETSEAIIYILRKA